MAGSNRKRKGAIDLAEFDESLLIGSISDMTAPAKEAGTQAANGQGATSKEDTPEAPVTPVASASPVEAEQPVVVTPAPAAQPAAATPEVKVQAAAPEPVAMATSDDAASTQTPEASPSERVGEQTPAPGNQAGKKEEKKARPGKAWEYDRFFTSTKGIKKSNIYISEANHQKVKTILTLLGNGASITDYVENMFAQHWEQYGPEIQKRISEHSFFK